MEEKNKSKKRGPKGPKKNQQKVNNPDLLKVEVVSPPSKSNTSSQNDHQSSIRIFPTFLLKGVDPVKLVSDYKSGKFSRDKQEKKQIEIMEVISPLSPVYSEDRNKGMFIIKDRNNTSIVIATSNHANYVTYRKTGSTIKGQICRVCFDEVKEEAVGYPIFFYEEVYFTQDERAQIKYHFLTEGFFCSFECALRHVRRNMSLQANFRDITMRDSERWLLFLFKLMHPDEILREAQDPDLLLPTGSLTREEWSDKKHVYIKTDRIVITPAKVEYVRSNFVEPRVPLIDLRKDK